MGIYGALATAVTGMRAQAFALENISGNIANSQTTGYKRLETGFIDLIPDAAVGRQVPGAVIAYSRSTNDVRGDIITSPTGTHIALNGSGFFVVSEKVGTSDGASVFGDTNYFTRRGDFEMDREGYLANGAGYYLKGVPINRSTGNVSGSVPELVKVDNGLIPAQQTSRINYSLNLPANPVIDLLDALASSSTNIGGMAGTDLLGTASWFGDGETFSINTGAGMQTFTEDGTGTQTLDDLIAWINGNSNATAEIVGGNLVITANDAETGLAFGGTASMAGLSTQPVPEFKDRTLEGGAITIYTANGAAVSVEMRWGKVAEGDPSATPPTGGTWQMFYLSSSNPEEWTAIDEMRAVFNENGTLQTLNGAVYGPDDIITAVIPNLSVNGTTINEPVRLNMGRGGLTQFSNASGRASDIVYSQNGYPAGSFLSVAVNDSGRVVATYSNGQQVELFQLVTANFNAENMLKRLDGGLYAATAQSGEPIFTTEGGITGGALESSNTDISEEFTKLIVTQQAYAAGTRIVSTSDEMLREALNMVR